jgi:hypothetical protein
MHLAATPHKHAALMVKAAAAYRVIQVERCQLAEAVGSLVTTQHAVVSEAEMVGNLVQPAAHGSNYNSHHLHKTVRKPFKALSHH